MDGKTHHASLDIKVMEVKGQKLTIKQAFKAAAAERHRGVVQPGEEPEREQAVRGDDLSWCGDGPHGLRRRRPARDPVHDRLPGADQRRAGGRVRDDARDQPRARRVRDDRRLHHDRQHPGRHRHLVRDAGAVAAGGGHHRPDRRAGGDPPSVRPHDRHHARHLGPEPADGGAGHADLRQHRGQRAGADPVVPGRRLPDGWLQPVHHRHRDAC